jgi:hypothetical protein
VLWRPEDWFTRVGMNEDSLSRRTRTTAPRFD